MAWCLMAPSHYMNQYRLIIRSTDIRLRAILLGRPQPSITVIGFKITYLRSGWNLPGANELMYLLPFRHTLPLTGDSPPVRGSSHPESPPRKPLSSKVLFPSTDADVKDAQPEKEEDWVIQPQQLMLTTMGAGTSGRSLLEFNSLTPGRYRCDFKNTIINLVLLMGIFRSHGNSLRWMLLYLTADKSTLSQVMALVLSGNKPLP